MMGVLHFRICLSGMFQRTVQYMGSVDKEQSLKHHLNRTLMGVVGRSMALMDAVGRCGTL